MKHVAILTASIEQVGPLHVVTCLECPALRVEGDDEEVAIASARKLATTWLETAAELVVEPDSPEQALVNVHENNAKIDAQEAQRFAESLSKLGDESVVPQESAAAPTLVPDSSNDDEAGTPQ